MPDFKEQLALALAKALDGKLSESEILGMLEVPPSADLGDFAFPCFKLSPLLKKGPQQIAVELQAKIVLPQSFLQAKSIGPYLNFFLKKQALAETVIVRVLKENKKFGFSKAGKARKVMVEYSSPNTNKPLHIGHLRNDSIGMAVSNILEANGCKVLRANLVNDRGIHICQSMLAYQKFGKGKSPKQAKKKSDHFVGDYYVLFAQNAKENPAFEEDAKALLKKWEAKDKPTIALWKKMNAWVLSGFRETYKRFGSRFDKLFFESQFYDKAKPLIEDGLQKGVFRKEFDGAIVADLEAYKLSKKIVLRADGTSIYVTNDLVLTKHKFEKFGLDEAVWVVASEQNFYFMQLFKIFELLGFSWAKKCRHLSYGMVFLPEGKMKSREGKVVDADDLIAEVVGLAKAEILKRGPNTAKKALEKRSLAIALAAIKFFLLRVSIQQDITFNPAESVSFDGETGPYVQYTHARAKSILAKAKGRPSVKGADFSLLESDSEKKVLSLLNGYPALVENSLQSLSPHAVCQYLLELSAAFNSFYHSEQVLKAESKGLVNARLLLVQATATVIANGLRLLNIEPIDKM